MTSLQLHEELVTQARRLVGEGIAEAKWIGINNRLGTIRDRSTDQLLHYDCGDEIVWPVWRTKVWSKG